MPYMDSIWDCRHYPGIACSIWKVHTVTQAVAGIVGSTSCHESGMRVCDHESCGWLDSDQLHYVYVIDLVKYEYKINTFGIIECSCVLSVLV